MVRWQDRYSRQFRVSQGVRQGALLSPLFYATFVNDLLTILESHKLGISIGSVYCGVLAYADDFALISNDNNELQAMLDQGSRKLITIEGEGGGGDPSIQHKHLHTHVL